MRSSLVKEILSKATPPKGHNVRWNVKFKNGDFISGADAEWVFDGYVLFGIDSLNGPMVFYHVEPDTIEYMIEQHVRVPEVLKSKLCPHGAEWDDCPVCRH